ARRRTPGEADADPGLAAEHAQPAERVPVRATLPVRGGAVPSGGAESRGDRAGASGAVLQPGPRGRVAAAAARRRGVNANGSASGNALVEVEDLKVYFPIRSG